MKIFKWRAIVKLINSLRYLHCAWYQEAVVATKKIHLYLQSLSFLLGEDTLDNMAKIKHNVLFNNIGALKVMLELRKVRLSYRQNKGGRFHGDVASQSGLKKSLPVP